MASSRRNYINRQRTELERAAAGPLAGLVAAFDAEAARMRATMGDQGGRGWLAMRPGDFAATGTQGAMFGADELRGQETMF